MLGDPKKYHVSSCPDDTPVVPTQFVTVKESVRQGGAGVGLLEEDGAGVGLLEDEEVLALTPSASPTIKSSPLRFKFAVELE